MERRRNCAGCLILIAVGILLVADPFHIVLGLRWGNEPFDQAQWKAAARREKPVQPNPRGKMLASLLRQHKLKGMAEAETSGLLGWPDEVDFLRKRTASPKAFEEWDYYLGMNSSTGVDEDILVIEFDRSGSVIRYFTYNT
ncbi:MAG: hypothetical protein ABFE08_12285 [Armatimonadia bacterium]